MHAHALKFRAHLETLWAKLLKCVCVWAEEQEAGEDEEEEEEETVVRRDVAHPRTGTTNGAKVGEYLDVSLQRSG